MFKMFTTHGQVSSQRSPPGQYQQTRGTPQTGYGSVAAPKLRHQASPVCSTCPDPCAGPRAKIRVVNSIINSPPGGFDIHVNSTKQFEEIDYTNVSNYAWVEAGEAHIIVRMAKQVDTILWETFDLGVNQPYTLLLLGDANAAKDSPTAIAAFLFRDHNIATQPCYANVRFIHASPGSPSVDVNVGDQAVFENVTYGQFDNRNDSAYQGFPSVSQRTGTPYKHLVSLVQHQESVVDPPPPAVVLLKPDSVSFETGHIYTIFAMGIYNDPKFPLSFVVTADWPEPPAHPTDLHEQTMTDKEIRIRDNLRKEVQRGSVGAYSSAREDAAGDASDGFAFAQLPPIGKQIAFPTETNVSFSTGGNLQPQESALLRVIHSISSVGVSISMEDEAIVRDLPAGRISEQMQVYPGTYAVKSFIGSRLHNEESVQFKKGGIYTMTVHKDHGDAQMHVHEDLPDSTLSHMKVINMSSRHGKGPGAATFSQSFDGSQGSIHPLPIISGSKLLQGPRPVLVPSTSHVTVFLLDAPIGDDISVFTNTVSLV